MSSPSSIFLQKIIDEGEWNINNNDIVYKQTIGKGNFGEVFKASWRKTPVAVKKLRSNIKNKEEFKMECKILNKLSHPNIIQFYGILLDKTYGMVIELLDDNLENYNYMNTKKIQAYEFILDIARGLHYLHNRSPCCIIHRDIKPSNLLLTRSKRVKICDFGISCFQYNPNELYNMTGETGTYRYMAPEVMKGEQYNSSVDIYSLGVVMYTLIEDTPFKNLRVYDVIKCVIHNNFKPKTFKHKKTEQLITRCWSYNASDRYTAEQIIDDIEIIIENEQKVVNKNWLKLF